MIKVLFVCTGNICRSPSGEGIFKEVVKKAGFENEFFIDSAGTIAYHSGEQADSRMKKHAAKRGIRLTSLSRQMTRRDLEEFDFIIAMDKRNYNDILAMDRSRQYIDKVLMMTEYSMLYRGQDVPDPYYGGAKGFEIVLDIIEESSTGLLNYIKSQHVF